MLQTGARVNFSYSKTIQRTPLNPFFITVRIFQITDIIYQLCRASPLLFLTITLLLVLGNSLFFLMHASSYHKAFSYVVLLAWNVLLVHSCFLVLIHCSHHSSKLSSALRMSCLMWLSHISLPCTLFAS